jgi:hypothetical protein
MTSPTMARQRRNGTLRRRPSTSPAWPRRDGCGRTRAGATLAMDVKAIRTPFFIFHQWFSIQNIQGGVIMILTSTSRLLRRASGPVRVRWP